MYNFVVSTASCATRGFPGAVVVYANFAQFSRGQKIQFPCVRSRMVLWCKSGSGTVTVNGKLCPFEAGRYLVLPWKHAIRYQAGEDDPFLLGGVHLIADHREDHPVLFDVAHDEQHPLAHAAYRRDVPIPELASVKLGWLQNNAPLLHLLEYIVHLFCRSSPEPWMARQLGRQLLCELIYCEQASTVHEYNVPPEVERMTRFIASQARQPLSLRDLVEFMQLSPATVGRLFRQHLKTTPVHWIRNMRMERAKTLLRTQRLSVAQVGAQVGIADPYYFSKCFKRHTGQSPSDYRRQTGWM